MAVYYITTNGEPPNGGRTPSQKSRAPRLPPPGPPHTSKGRIPYPPMFCTPIQPSVPAPAKCFPSFPRFFKRPPPVIPGHPSPKAKAEPKKPEAPNGKPKTPPAYLCYPTETAAKVCTCGCKPTASSPNPKPAVAAVAAAAAAPPRPPQPKPSAKPPSPPKVRAQPAPLSPRRAVPPDTSEPPATQIHPRATLLSPPTAVVHLIQRGHHPWDHPYCAFDFTLHEVPTSVAVWELIEVIRPTGDADRKLGVVEAIECGDGIWKRGAEFRLDGEKAGQTLEELGWGGERGRWFGGRGDMGRGRKVVWIAYG